MRILYLPEVWHCNSDGSGAAITDFGGARISDELALKKRRIQLSGGFSGEPFRESVDYVRVATLKHAMIQVYLAFIGYDRSG